MSRLVPAKKGSGSRINGTGPVFEADDGGDGMGLFPISKEEKIEALRREIRQRQHVYPRQVMLKKMTQAFADQQIKLMEAILQDYLDGNVKT